MPQPKTRTLTVINRQPLSANMVRMTLGGDELKNFPENQESGYVKLVFPAEARGSDDAAKQRPRVRSYTIRSFDAKAIELDLDFVTHGDNGPASAWAMQAKPGDEITISGPGPTKLANASADWFFLAGDLSALPAISVNLEKLPANAVGYAVLEVIDESDKLKLNVPDGIELHWVLNPHPETENTLLADKVRSLPWLEGTPYVWVASEFEAMRNMRRYFKTERGVGKKDVYASSYWKIGTTDEGNKAAKRGDLEAD